MLIDSSWHNSGAQNLAGFVSKWVEVFKLENLLSFRPKSVVDFIGILNVFRFFCPLFYTVKFPEQSENSLDFKLYYL